MYKNRDSEILRSEATVDFKRAIASKINSFYPLIDTPEKVNQFASPTMDGINHGSFQWTGQFSPVEVLVLNTAFLNATNPRSAAFCEHAQRGHRHTFKKALENLRLSINSPQPGATESEVQIARKGNDTEYRLVLTTPIAEHDFNRPPAYIWALGLNGQLNGVDQKGRRKIIAREIRSISLEKGTAFGFLAATYLSIPTEDFFEIFSNSDKGYTDKLHSANQILPKIKNREHAGVLNALSKLLMSNCCQDGHPIYDEDKYKQALNLLKTLKFISPEDTSFNAVSTRLKIKSRAVILGVPEVAFGIASSNFHDPERSQWIITNYDRVFTTELITAYLLFQEKLPKW